MEFDDLRSLSDAAAALGVSVDTLRTQIHRGRFAAHLVGNCWITTRQEVERYRAESRGRAGRPVGVVETRPRERGDR